MNVRDPVHGLMSFEGRAHRVLAALVDCRELQRLRQIRQLGWTSVAFPGAEHTRFSHSLGAAYVMSLLQRRLRQTESDLPSDVRMTTEDEEDALAGSLLHDLGHGPFSHLFEDLVPIKGGHESWTRRILLDPSTDVHRALEQLREGMAESVAELLAGRARLPYLARSVSGTLDVDRCDYLLRDSLMTGVRYGVVDLAWLLSVLSVRQVPEGDWVMAVNGEKGLPPIEGYFLGRHHMHQQVYYHRTTRSAERLVQQAFVRVLELIGEQVPVEPLPAAFRQMSAGEAVSVDDYLSLHDSQFLAALSAWQQHPDVILRDMAQRICRRVLYKSFLLPEDGALKEELIARVRAVAVAHPWGAERAVVVDRIEHAPYDEPSSGPDGIWVALRRGGVVRLSEASFFMKQFLGKVTVSSRLLFVPELEPTIRDTIRSVWSG